MGPPTKTGPSLKADTRGKSHKQARRRRRGNNKGRDNEGEKEKKNASTMYVWPNASNKLTLAIVHDISTQM